MQVVEYNTNLYPYGLLYMGGKPYLSNIPELRKVHSKSLPVEVIHVVADTMNADLRAGWDRDHIEGLVKRRVQAALELL